MKRKRILIVDDTESVARLFATALEEEGYDVTIAGGGKEGFDATSFGDYQLVLMDLHMPRLNGIETIRALRLVNGETKIAVVSGHLESFEAELEEEPVDAVLNKPLPIDALRKTVLRLIGPPEA